MSIPNVPYPPFDDGTPQNTDIPRDNQEEFINNFFTMNEQLRVDHIPPGNIVKTVTVSGGVSILEVAQHYLETGDNITLTNFKAINDLGNLMEWSINGNSYDVTVIDEDSFSIPVDTSGEPTYQENSGSYLVNELDFYGFHKKVTFLSPIIPLKPIDVTSNQGILFTQKVTDKGTEFTAEGFVDKESISLFFQKASEILRITGNNYDQLKTKVPFPPPNGNDGYATVSQYSIDSPFGIKINFGFVRQLSDARNEQQTIPLKLPYTTTHFCTVASVTHVTKQSSSARVRIPTANLTSFDILPSSTRDHAIIYFVSMGI